nr:hypothetical protein [Tanacetum cinerariifolium]
MTGNKSYLVEYQDFNGGPVAFGGACIQTREKKAKTGLNIEEGNFNKLDDLVSKGDDYAINEGRSTDKIKVLNVEAEGVSAAGETL